MAHIRLRYVVEDVDRHGNVRLYVRRPGHPKIRIRAVPGTLEFAKAYEAALTGTSHSSPEPARRVPAGSFAALCQRYFASADFKRLDPSTQAWRRRALLKVCGSHGDKPVALMEPRHVRKLRDELAEMPGAANTRLKAMKALFSWAVEADEAKTSPARDVKLIRYLAAGHHSWIDDEIAQFEKRHPIGTKARLALALLLYTAGRREDAVRLGSQHIRDKRLRFTQAKNEHRNPIEIDIPLHAELARIIEATPIGEKTFLVTGLGKPHSPAGFGNKFREWCDEAGLPHCSAHGLRKAAATRLAEHGATAHEIMAVTGHQSLEEVERYTRAARRAKLADGAVAKLSAHEGSVPLFEESTSRWDKSDKKISEINAAVTKLALPRGLEPLFSP